MALPQFGSWRISAAHASPNSKRTRRSIRRLNICERPASPIKKETSTIQHPIFMTCSSAAEVPLAYKTGLPRPFSVISSIPSIHTLNHNQHVPNSRNFAFLPLRVISLTLANRLPDALGQPCRLPQQQLLAFRDVRAILPHRRPMRSVRRVLSFHMGRVHDQQLLLQPLRRGVLLPRQLHLRQLLPHLCQQQSVPTDLRLLPIDGREGERRWRRRCDDHVHGATERDADREARVKSVYVRI